MKMKMKNKKILKKNKKKVKKIKKKIKKIKKMKVITKVKTKVIMEKKIKKK